MNAHDKVTAGHLKRTAYLYIRQSTLQQVLENRESTQRQYDLRRRAKALGWPDEQIVVIDSDQGQSGASAADREGFQRLVSEVGTGRAGIVMGLEVSRLARNSSDWHRLLEICALSDTLILDEDGVYDPSHFNDRLLLGLKGTMSEAELHVLRARLLGGYMAKARRGELRIKLPVGFVYDAAGQVRLDPDRQVFDAVSLLFSTFRRTGTAGATVRSFLEQDLRFPTRPPHGPRMGELVWVDLTCNKAVKILHNPRYAGAYALGRTRQRKTPEGRTTKNVGRDEWTVLIVDAHEGYISWEEFEENQKRLKDNSYSANRCSGETPPREGSALLQGIVLCGVCGKRMTVRYSQLKGKRVVPWYYCSRDPMLRYLEGHCQNIPGATIDAAVSELVVKKMTPMALEVALSVHEELKSRFEEADRLRREQVERARYEADVARRRYMRVDPDNRLVADSLEAEWNEKLRALTQAQEDYERQRQADNAVLTPEQRERIVSLAGDFPAVWQAPATTDRDRKRMLRLIVEDATLLKDEQTINVHLRFRGGATQSLSLPRPLPSWKIWSTPPEVLSEMDRLLDEHTDAETAAILNERGFSTGKGIKFYSKIVSQLRRKHGLKSRFDRLREKGFLTVNEMACTANVTRKTILRWTQGGHIESYAYNDRNQCLYDPKGHIPKKNDRSLSRRKSGEEEPNPKSSSKEKGDAV